MCVRGGAFVGAALAITNLLPQIMLETSLFSMGIIRFVVGTAIILIVFLVLLAVTGKVKLSLLVTMVLFAIMGTINAYVYSFRGVMLEPMDIFSARTAINVAGNYSLFPIPGGVLLGWMMVLFCVVRFIMPWRIEGSVLVKQRILSVVVCACLSVGLSFYVSDLKTYHWYTEGAIYNGYILDFMAKIKEIQVDEPYGYDSDTVELITGRYEMPETEEEETPHIIAIMDEAFADISVVGDVSTSAEVMPFISLLQEDAITGYALASVYGGNTANSEYEFLTSNSMAWLPTGTVPYQQYINEDAYSMVSYLKSSYDYNCIAMHPYHSSGWNRTSAYQHLGYDEWMFLEEFPQENLLRDYVSDMEMFEEIIRVYEENKGNPLFLFGITMQNHGGYEYEGYNFELSVELTDYANQYPKAEQYLSCIHETDKAVEMLIEYFRDVEEPVVIVFFGDHQPKIEEELYEVLNGGTLDTLDEKQQMYKVPFFVWANYDIEEQQVECTSLNYLANYVYEAAGIPLPPYNQFLEDVMEEIPAMNANGYYSKEQNGFIEYEEAVGKEEELLEEYRILQYNAIFDDEERSEEMFGGSRTSLIDFFIRVFP